MLLLTLLACNATSFIQLVINILLLILVEILELNAFTFTFSLYAILLPGPILCSLSIQYEGIPLSFANLL